MPGQRQDYLLTQIELLRQFVARLLDKRDAAGLDEALRVALGLQEKLFPLPVAEFLQLEPHAQLAALKTGESPAGGQEKCLLYAQLLQTTATLYEFRGRSDLAFGARQLALHTALLLAFDHPLRLEPIAALITGLRPHVVPEDLHPPVRELLQAYESRPA